MGTHTKFDNVTRSFAKATTRRQALKTLGVGVGAALVGTKINRASATSNDFATKKCAWLKENFPQTTADVQALGAKLAGVDKTRIRVSPGYRCSSSNSDSAMDGFFVLGPNEGFSGMVTMTVPKYGAIDAYSTDASCGGGAVYTGDFKLVAGGHTDPCDDTYRASNGTVTALSESYYPYNDDNPPPADYKFDPGTTASGSGGSTASSTPASGDAMTWCLSVDDLLKNSDYVGKFEIMADSEQTDDITKYGGRRVTALADFKLPDGWAAKTNGPDLAGGDLVVKGDTVTLYPPTGACRDKLGVSN